MLGGTVLSTLPNLNDDELIATAVLAIFGATVSFVCSVLLKLYYKRSKWHRLMKKYKKSKNIVQVLLGILAICIVGILFFGDSANFWEVDMKIIETGPSFKGDTAQGGTKPATLETGLTISVPLFLDIGQIVKVDTRSSDYISRA